MPWIFWDASALAKRYAPEPGTSLVNEAFHLLVPSRMIFSRMGILEIIFLLVRKRNGGRLTQVLFDQAMMAFSAEITNSPDMNLAAIDDTLIVSALPLIEVHNLNASDAVVLRLAMDLEGHLRLSGDHLSLWSADKRLIRAAKKERLIPFDPEAETLANLKQMLGV